MTAVLADTEELVNSDRTIEITHRPVNNFLSPRKI